MRAVLLLCLLVCISGCGNPINMKTAENYKNAGLHALDAGDWKSARMHFNRSWWNAKVGHADPRIVSELRYEYGRASGVVCEWDEAELALNESFEIDSKTNGPLWMPLVELERMSIAQKDYSKARGYFDKLMPILEEISIETKDPLGYADVLDEYSLVLENTGDPAKAKEHRQRSQQLREVFQGKESNTDITPYGTQCNS